MIRFTSGNLLESGAVALVNTVNTVGVMGKGIALMFKDAFPENFRAYAQACKRGEVVPGRMFVTRPSELHGPEWIVNFPTKLHWRQPSRLEWVVAGLMDLRRWIEREQVASIAVPPLGAGNGGLDWADVRQAIEAGLAGLPATEVIVYEPVTEYQNVAKRSGTRTLTPARALIVEAIRFYSGLGVPCSLLEAQKLAWFIEVSAADLGLPSPLSLRFQPDHYGPYADGLRHLMEKLDGSYLHSARRINDAPHDEEIWCDLGLQDRVTAFVSSGETRAFRPVMERMKRTVDQFQSPFGMELLATVDWVRRDGAARTVDGIGAAIAAWPKGPEAARRKTRLFDARVIGLALRRLEAESPLPVH